MRCIETEYAGAAPVRCFETDEPALLEAVFRLRYVVYVEEMRRRQPHADPVARRLAEPLDRDALHVVACAAGAGPGEVAGGEGLLGALRISLSRHGGLETIERLYGLDAGGFGDRSMVITRLVTRPEARGGASSAGLALACAAYRIGLRERLTAGFIDCHVGLEPLFVWLGFDPIRRFTHADYGEIAVMRIDPLDRARLARTDSPFLRILAGAEDSGSVHSVPTVSGERECARVPEREA
ncbi:MAG: hypothetical protein R3F16_12610 [Myxococcota bacterium]